MQLTSTFQSHRKPCLATSIKDASKRRWWREISLIWCDIGMQVRHVRGEGDSRNVRSSWGSPAPAVAAQQEGGGGRFRTSSGGRLLATTGNLPRFCFSSKVLFPLAATPGNRPFFLSHVNPTLCNTLLVVIVKLVKKEVEQITCACK